MPEGAFTDTTRAAFTAEDFRFTQKEGVVYAICLARPQTETHIRALAAGDGAPSVRSVRLLGLDGELVWRQDEAGLHIVLPAELPGQHAFTFKIE